MQTLSHIELTGAGHIMIFSTKVTTGLYWESVMRGIHFFIVILVSCSSVCKWWKIM